MSEAPLSPLLEEEGWVPTVVETVQDAPAHPRARGHRSAPGQWRITALLVTDGEGPDEAGVLRTLLAQAPPSPPEARRYAALGAWCAPDALGWRRAAGWWARGVAIPATTVLHLLVWLLLGLPLSGAHWPPLRGAAPPSPAELIRLGEPRGWPGRAWLTGGLVVVLPLYGLVALAQRPLRLLLAVPPVLAVAFAAHLL